jgi:hypothetical protein
MSIEELLRETLDERVARVTGDEDLAENVIRRSRGRRGRRAVAGLSALVVVVIVVVLTLAQTAPRNTAVVPDPRATAVPSVSPITPLGSISGVDTTYRILQGPQPSTKASGGAPISVTPRVERRGTTTWLVTPTTSVALPTSVNGARSIQQAGSSWVVFTVSNAYTGGDTDPYAQILVVSASGAVKSLVTGAVRSVAVNLDGTQVASVETVERPTWSVTLVVRRLADGGVVRTVALPYGQPGSGSTTLLHTPRRASWRATSRRHHRRRWHRTGPPERRDRRGPRHRHLLGAFEYGSLRHKRFGRINVLGLLGEVHNYFRHVRDHRVRAPRRHHCARARAGARDAHRCRRVPSPCR